MGNRRVHSKVRFEKENGVYIYKGREKVFPIRFLFPKIFKFVNHYLEKGTIMSRIISILTPEFIDAFSRLNLYQVVGVCFIVTVFAVLYVVKNRHKNEKK